MKLICITTLVAMLVTLNTLVTAQENTKRIIKTQAYKTDQFYEMNDSELKTKLDSFFDELLKNKRLKGYVLIFGGRNQSTDLTREKVLKNINWKLLHNRFYVTLLKGKVKNSQITEFWLVPTETDILPKKKTK